ncbi:MAG: redoxin domain-containing protein [Bacteroidota bacterium]
MNLKNVLFFALLTVIKINVTAGFNAIDSVKPEIGKPMPDFVLRDVSLFKKKTVSLNDFKGKWLFLDFWTVGCAACVKSFPKVNSLHREFRDRVTWMMVGVNDRRSHAGTEKFYEKIRSKRTLEIPYVFDSVLCDRWKIQTVPHIIIVDPEGIVRFITGGGINPDKVKKLLAGEKVDFYYKDAERRSFDPDIYLSTANANSGKNLLYRSLLTKWNSEKQAGIVNLDRWLTWPEEYLEKGFQCSMCLSAQMYMCAYTGWPYWRFDDPVSGLYYPKLVLETRDSLRLKLSSDIEYYNYNLTLPVERINKVHLMEILQQDLKRYFGYEAALEDREISVWKLVAKPSAIEKLRSKGEKQYFSPGSHAVGFEVRNVSYLFLLGEISHYLPYEESPIIDETGITGNIDFSLNADMTSIEDIRRAIQKQGFDMVKGKKVMKAVVIRDPKKF